MKTSAEEIGILKDISQHIRYISTKQNFFKIKVFATSFTPTKQITLNKVERKTKPNLLRTRKLSIGCFVVRVWNFKFYFLLIIFFL